MLLPPTCDVAIFGAGPAGTATALALYQLQAECSIVLVDGGRPRRPASDETLGEASRPLLAELGLWERFRAMRPPAARGTLAAWGGPVPREAPFFVAEGRGFRVSRSRFEATFRVAARQQGVHLASATQLAATSPAADGWSLDLRTADGERRTLKARFVVDATGHQALVAQSLGARKVYFDRLIGAFAVTAGKTVAFDRADALVEAHEHGFWYGAPLAADRSVVAFLTDVDLARDLGLGEEQAFRRLLGESALLSPLGEPEAAPTVYTLHSHRLDQAVGDDWLAVGDAAATADPLSAQGLEVALDTAVQAAAAIADALAGRPSRLRRYQHGVELRAEAYLERRPRVYGREGRFAEAPFWSRRGDRSSVEPDQLLTTRGDPAGLDGPAMYLAAAELRLLASLCAAPRLVDAVVQALRESLEHPPSERRIHLALAHLVDRGLISAE